MEFDSEQSPHKEQFGATKELVRILEKSWILDDALFLHAPYRGLWIWG